jgi:hypothetical protein
MSPRHVGPPTVPFLAHDSCARCSRDFHEVNRVVSTVIPKPDGGLGIQVCPGCVDGSVDRIAGMSLYLAGAGERLPEAWPVYYATPGALEGFVRCNRLDNGVVRIALKRGHADIWTPAEQERAPTTPGQMGYAVDYGLYGPVELFQPGGCYRVIASKFIDLARPDRVLG